MTESHEATTNSVPTAGSLGGGEPFLHLAQRAESFIAEQGGSASEDLLISHVFGSAGTPSLWRPLLQNVLGRHEGLQRRADGAWLLANLMSDSGESPLERFVVLDIETTGLQASRQRIIEVAIATFERGTQRGLWESLCNPGRRVPAYVVKLTGIDDTMLEEAPPFVEIVETVVELLSGAIVIGHNVEFDIAFLNEELKRANRAPVVNDRLDTLTLASRLIPSLRKPTLRAAADHLGIANRPGREHRAGFDASLTGHVALALLGPARDAGFYTLDDLKAIARPQPRRPRERMPRASSVVDRSLLADIPRAPGVYIMRDANERVVYVGKAKCLRDRVGSYFSQPLGYTRKMDGLIESLSRIQVEVVGSELEALLLESQLIRRYQPRYNTALRSHEQYPFIRIDVANPWPRVSLAKARKADGAEYFGPFRSATAARKTVDLINRVVPLRTCTRSFRDARSYGSPCLQLDLGRCLGPCVGRADWDAYMALVRNVVSYIDGRDQALHEVLWQGLEDAAAALDFERASRLRRELHASLALTTAQRRLRESTESSWLVLVTPSARAGSKEIMLILRGRMWSQQQIGAGDSPAQIAMGLSASWERFLETGIGLPDHDSVDDMHILGSWLAKHERHPALLPVTRPPAVPDWLAIAQCAIALTPAELDFDAWRKARDEADSGWAETAQEQDEAEIVLHVRHDTTGGSHPDDV
jgi:DNA polymerase III epsilon subunit family exonuclease